MAFHRGIAVAGNMLIDRIKLIPRLPERGALVKVLSIEESFGGAAYNTGVDLAKLDPRLNVNIVGVAGADADGDKLLGAFSAYPNINTSRVKRRGRQSSTDVLTEADTRARTFLTHLNSCDQFCVEDVDVDALDCDIFHIGYILLLGALDAPDDEYGTKLARLLRSIQKTGVLTSVDVVSEASDRYARLVPPSLKYLDYLTVNEIEAGKTVGLDLRSASGELNEALVKEALARLKRMGVKRRVIIHTPEGGFGLDEANEYRARASVKLKKGYIKGTVGAGDAFCAGALLAAYRGEPLLTALTYASAAAACSLAQPGSTEGVVQIEEALRRAAALESAEG